MKWCCSRSTTGIVIGSIYIAASIIYLIIKIIIYLKYNGDERLFVLSIIYCSAVASISALFIVAIITKNELLAIPWILQGFFIFFDSLVRPFLMYLVYGYMSHVSEEVLIYIIVGVLLAIGIQVAILLFTVDLFRGESSMADATLI